MKRLPKIENKKLEPKDILLIIRISVIESEMKFFSLNNSIFKNLFVFLRKYFIPIEIILTDHL